MWNLLVEVVVEDIQKELLFLRHVSVTSHLLCEAPSLHLASIWMCWINAEVHCGVPLSYAVGDFTIWCTVYNHFNASFKLSTFSVWNVYILVHKTVVCAVNDRKSLSHCLRDCLVSQMHKSVQTSLNRQCCFVANFVVLWANQALSHVPRF